MHNLHKDEKHKSLGVRDHRKVNTHYTISRTWIKCRTSCRQRHGPCSGTPGRLTGRSLWTPLWRFPKSRSEAMKFHRSSLNCLLLSHQVTRWLLSLTTPTLAYNICNVEENSTRRLVIECERNIESNDTLAVLQWVTGPSNLQKKAHEAGLLDVVVEPAPAPGWWQLLAQHGGHIRVPDTVKNIGKINLLN